MVADWYNLLLTLGGSVFGAGGSHAALVLKGKTKVNVDDIVNKVLDGLRGPIAKQVEGVVAGITQSAEDVNTVAESVTNSAGGTTTVETENETQSQKAPAPTTPAPAPAPAEKDVPLSGVVNLLNDLRLDASGDNVVKVVNWAKDLLKAL